MSKSGSWLAFAALLAGAGIVHAHHSISMIDLSTPTWVQGTVVRFQAADPHAMIELEEKQANGQSRRWIVEGPRPARFEQILEERRMAAGEAFLKPGDAISVCGFSLKRQYAAEKMYADWQPVAGRFIHGEVLVMPDSRMQAWGPYGKMDNCVRGGDKPELWMEFLNRDRLAQNLWCIGQTYVQVASVAPRAFVDDVNRRLEIPCK